MNTFLNSLTGDQAQKSNYNSQLSTSVKDTSSPDRQKEKATEKDGGEVQSPGIINDRQRFKNMIKTDKKIRFKMAGLLKRKEQPPAEEFDLQIASNDLLVKAFKGQVVRKGPKETNPAKNEHGVLRVKTNPMKVDQKKEAKQ